MLQDLVQLASLNVAAALIEDWKYPAALPAWNQDRVVTDNFLVRRPRNGMLYVCRHVCFFGTVVSSEDPPSKLVLLRQSNFVSLALGALPWMRLVRLRP